MDIVTFPCEDEFSASVPTEYTYTRTDFGAGCVQLWIRSAEPPGEHRYENKNNKHMYCTCTRNEVLAKAHGNEYITPTYHQQKKLFYVNENLIFKT